MGKVGKYIFKIVRNIVLAFCFIYGFDLIASGLNIVIPLNFITIGLVTFLGLPGLLALIGVYFVLV